MSRPKDASSPKRRLSPSYKRQAIGIRWAEALPHYPPIAGRYYINTSTERTDGSKLRELVNMFSPATDLDRELILSALSIAILGWPAGIFSDGLRHIRRRPRAARAHSPHQSPISWADPSTFHQTKTSPGLKRESSRRHHSNGGCTPRQLESLKFSWGEFEGSLRLHKSVAGNCTSVMQHGRTT